MGEINNAHQRLINHIMPPSTSTLIYPVCPTLYSEFLMMLSRHRSCVPSTALVSPSPPRCLSESAGGSYIYTIKIKKIEILSHQD